MKIIKYCRNLQNLGKTDEKTLILETLQKKIGITLSLTQI